MPEIEAKQLFENGIELGEGPVWDGSRNVLTWVDISGKSFYIFHTERGEVESVSTPQMVSYVQNFGEDCYLTALEDGIYLYKEGDFVLQSSLPGYNGRIRFNDGTQDRKGRLYIGTMGIDKDEAINKNAGKLFLYQNRSFTPLLSDVTVSNGIAIDYKRARFYFNDTPTGEVSVFHYDEETGLISDRKKFVAISPKEGLPDGMTIDFSGNIYVALWNGGGVKIFDPEGQFIGFIRVDEENVTSVEFGFLINPPGSSVSSVRNRQVLYITTAQNDKGKGGALYYIPVNELSPILPGQKV